MAPLSVHDAIAAAWKIDPVRAELETNQDSADVRAKAAQSWFAGGPTLTGDYYDDRISGSNHGYITWQGGVSVPLWLPGQGQRPRTWPRPRRRLQPFVLM